MWRCREPRRPCSLGHGPLGEPEHARIRGTGRGGPAIGQPACRPAAVPAFESHAGIAECGRGGGPWTGGPPADERRDRCMHVAQAPMPHCRRWPACLRGAGRDGAAQWVSRTLCGPSIERCVPRNHGCPGWHAVRRRTGIVARFAALQASSAGPAAIAIPGGSPSCPAVKALTPAPARRSLAVRVATTSWGLCSRLNPTDGVPRPKFHGRHTTLSAATPCAADAYADRTGGRHTPPERSPGIDPTDLSWNEPAALRSTAALSPGPGLGGAPRQQRPRQPHPHDPAPGGRRALRRAPERTRTGPARTGATPHRRGWDKNE